MNFQSFQDLELVDLTLTGQLYGFDAETSSGQETVGNEPAVPPYDYSITNC